MKTSFFVLFSLCSNILIGQKTADITFRITDKNLGEQVVKIEDGDQFTLEISTNMILHLSKAGEKEKTYTSGAKKNSLNYMSYLLGDEKHEFNLVEGTSPNKGSNSADYSLLLEKVYESEDIVLYFSPVFMFEQYNPLSKYDPDTVKYLARDHYLSYGNGILSKHDGTVSSLSNRLAFAACKCTSKKEGEPCIKTIRDKFGESRKVLSQEEMIDIITFWESNCSIKK